MNEELLEELRQLQEEMDEISRTLEDIISRAAAIQYSINETEEEM